MVRKKSVEKKREKKMSRMTPRTMVPMTMSTKE